jgi:hypothetical protein
MSSTLKARIARLYASAGERATNGRTPIETPHDWLDLFDSLANKGLLRASSTEARVLKSCDSIETMAADDEPHEARGALGRGGDGGAARCQFVRADGARL